MVNLLATLNIRLMTDLHSRWLSMDEEWSDTCNMHFVKFLSGAFSFAEI